MSHAEIKNTAWEMAKTNKWNVWKPVLVVGIIEALIEELTASIAGTESILASILSILISLAIIPMSIGMISYMVKLVKGEEFKLSDLFAFYSKNALGIIGAMFCVGLLTFFFSLLLVIPGIVVALGYTLVPYLYATKDSSLSVKEALATSKELMNGHKMDYFLFGLSFIGWAFLMPFTLGILAIWIMPYITIANTLYLTNIMESKS